MLVTISLLKYNRGNTTIKISYNINYKMDKISLYGSTSCYCYFINLGKLCEAFMVIIWLKQLRDFNVMERAFTKSVFSHKN